nr:reverse transcriptase domain-containing protein [Tanacetum cinerariifolium]
MVPKQARTTRANPDPTRTTTATEPMTQEAINNLIAQRVAKALVEYKTQRNSVVNEDTSNTTGTGPRTVRPTRECTYKDYLNCGPLKFNGTEGVIGFRIKNSKFQPFKSLSELIQERQLHKSLGERPGDHLPVICESNSRSNRRRVPNIVESETRTIEEIVPMADRTMEELLQEPTEGYGEAIIISEILAENFEIKTNLLQDVPNDAIKLMLFSYSLEGAARIWYEKEPPDSILTWDDLASTSGTLPSNIVPNPKGKMKAVTTRSGLAYEGPSIPTNSPLEKSLLTNKDKLFELAKVSLNENCSAMLLKKLPEKLRDPGKFLIPCDSPGIDVCHALADRGTIVKSSSPTLTPFGESDFFLEEIEDFLNDESIPTGIDNSFYDPEGDILYLEKLLNEDPFQLPPMDLKQVEETKAKSSIEEPLELELKELPSYLEYAFLENTNKLPVIIAKDLKDVEKEALIKVLKSHKRRKITNQQFRVKEG